MLISTDMEDNDDVVLVNSEHSPVINAVTIKEEEEFMECEEDGDPFAELEVKEGICVIKEEDIGEDEESDMRDMSPVPSSVTSCVWSRQIDQLLIQLVKECFHLWDPEHPKFFNKKLKNESYEKIAKELQIAVGDDENAVTIDREIVKRKFGVMKGYYAKEQRKMAARSAGGGEKCKSKWDLYEAMSFLGDMTVGGRKKVSKKSSADMIKKKSLRDRTHMNYCESAADTWDSDGKKISKKAFSHISRLSRTVLRCRAPLCGTAVCTVDPHGTCAKHRGVCKAGCPHCEYLNKHPKVLNYVRQLERKRQYARMKRNSPKLLKRFLKNKQPKSHPALNEEDEENEDADFDSTVSRENSLPPSESNSNSSFKMKIKEDIKVDTTKPVSQASISSVSLVDNVMKTLQDNLNNFFKSLSTNIVSQGNISLSGSSFSNKFKKPNLPRSHFEQSNSDTDYENENNDASQTDTGKFASYHKQFYYFYPDFFTVEPQGRHVVALPRTPKKSVPLLSLPPDILEATWLGKPPLSLASSHNEVWGTNVTFPTRSVDPTGDRFVADLPYNRFSDDQWEEYISAAPLKQVKIDPLLADKTSIPVGEVTWSSCDYLSRTALKASSTSDRYLQLAEKILEDLESDTFKEPEKATVLLHNAIRLARVANSKNISAVGSIAANARHAIRIKTLDSFEASQPKVSHHLMRGCFGHPDPLGPLHRILAEEAQRDKHIRLKFKKVKPLKARSGLLQSHDKEVVESSAE